MADIAIFRINYKSDFILTLHSDAGWMTPFCIKFWTGAPSQAYYAYYDGMSYTHCAPVDGEPTKLRVQFDDHHLPIGDLKFQIGYHFTVADFPTSVEDEVINQASVIIEVDDAPAQVMLDLNGETAPEIEFSLPAYANEAQRIANEQQRIQNEQQRIANEEQRIQNEQQRIHQEQERVQEFNQIKYDLDGAADAANYAATLANEKAALAQQKAEYAKAQGDYAKEQGNYAKEQGDVALADHLRAEEDHGIAVDDHTQAGTDHTRAESDHGIAVDDHTQAGTDHTRAKSDHGIAADDHTQAGNDHTRAESDHGIAVDDHTQAGSDHTRAESDHGIAVDDHTQAGNDHTRAESDHGIAVDDHTQAGTDHQTAQSDHTIAGNDHTQAGSDHTRAESDHTRAEADHAAVEVYVDSLGAFDISAYHATGGVLAKYADLTAALGPNGANIPDALRKGGMSVKYVNSSDSKYVQYRLMATSWSITPSDWQGIVEPEPIDILNFSYVQGSFYQNNYYSSNNNCISCLDYIDIEGLNNMLVVNQKQQNGKYWKVRVVFFDDSKTYIKQEGYTFIEGSWNIPILANMKYARFSISLIDSDGTDLNCTPSDIPTDGTKILLNKPTVPFLLKGVTELQSNVNELQSNVNELQKEVLSINLFKLPYLQGSLYPGIPSPNNNCIYCPNYIKVINTSTIIINNEKQQNGKYWKIRVCFYDSSKTFISYVGYDFVDGDWQISVPNNAKYARFAISLIDSDGTDLNCTPSDIPTDGTEILCNGISAITELQSNVTELRKEIQSEASNPNVPIPLNKLLGYSFTYLFSVTSGYGDAACYNGLIFQFINGNQYVYVHNAADGTLVQTITMPNPNTKYHNNSVTFGNAKYDEEDTYPLLYASQENSTENKCIVYRVTGTTGNLVLNVVQAITYPANSATGVYYHNCYIDTKNNYLILGGLVNSSYSSTDGNTLQYMAFNLPALSDGDVTLDIADVLFKSAKFSNMPTTQGGFCKNGYLYQVFGVNAPQTFMIFDIKHCKFCYIFNFTDELMNAEPEGAFEYDNKVCVVFNGGAVYKLNP